MSPAAYTPGTFVSRYSLTTRPSRTSMGVVARNCVFRVMPKPTPIISVCISQIYPCDTAMGQRVVPCTHGMMFVHRQVKEFSYVPGRIHAWDIRFQIFIDDKTFPDFDGRCCQKLCVQGNAQTDPDHIGLYLTTLLRLYITRHAIIRNDAFNLISV